MRKFILFILIGFSFQALAQVTPSKYLVKFTNKANSTYNITNPESFLSQRAIDRRIKYGISVDFTDLPINSTYIQGVIATGAKLIIQVKWINAIIISTETATVLDAINNLSYVSGVERINKSTSNLKSKDKFFIEEESVLKSINADPVYGDAYNQINMVNGIPLHQNGFKGEGKVIAVLDAGFTNVDKRSIFNSLWTNNQILGSYNFVDPATSVYGFHTHGTLVLSVMGGYLPGVFLGTAPNAGYWLLRTEDTSTEFLIEEYNWIAGAAFADSVGADIINSSLGYSQFDNPIYNHVWTDLDGNTVAVTNAADLAAKKGMLIVNSAGNSGNDPWKYLIAPADGDSVFSIGAVDANKNITSFSSYGFDWDSRVKPNIVAQGGSTVLANANTDAIAVGNGTSFSSPLIAGMMACLWQSMPNASNMELIRAVEQSASKFNSPDKRYGYGIPNFVYAKLILGLSENLNLINDFIVAPNPVSKSTLIKWNQTINSFDYIELLDLRGRVLLKQELNKNANFYQLSFDGFKNGIYLLQIGNQSTRLSKKIIKIN